MDCSEGGVVVDFWGDWCISAVTGTATLEANCRSWVGGVWAGGVGSGMGEMLGLEIVVWTSSLEGRGPQVTFLVLCVRGVEVAGDG